MGRIQFLVVPDGDPHFLGFFLAPWSHLHSYCLFPSYQQRMLCVESLPDFLFCYKAIETVCLAFFSVTVIKYHDRGNLRKEKFIWAYRSRGMSSPHHRQQAWQHGRPGAWGSTESSHLKLQVGSRHNNLKCLSLSTLKPSPSDTGLATRPHLPGLLKHHQTGNQKFKGRNLWRTFSFKPLHCALKALIYLGVWLMEKALAASVAK